MAKKDKKFLLKGVNLMKERWVLRGLNQKAVLVSIYLGFNKQLTMEQRYAIYCALYLLTGRRKLPEKVFLKLCKEESKLKISNRDIWTEGVHHGKGGFVGPGKEDFVLDKKTEEKFKRAVEEFCKKEKKGKKQPVKIK
jgi:hypothetical protein